MIQLKVKRTKKKNNKLNRDALSSNKKGRDVVSNGDDTELPSLRLCYMVEDYETFRDSEKPTENIAQLFSQRVKANS